MNSGLLKKMEATPLFEGDDLRWVNRRLSLDESFRYCGALTRSHAKSFFFSSITLPRHKKNAAYSIYAFCRLADDLLDEKLVRTEEGRDEWRRKLTELLEALYRQEDLALPFAPAFRDTVMRYHIPLELFMELIEGVCMDQGLVRMKNFEELHLYCYRVASVVGLMMGCVFGLGDQQIGKQRAVEMGVAMQLTNILRDIKEDWQKGRIYLPEDEMKRFGYTEKDLEGGVVDDRWRNLIRFQIERARNYYREAEKGIHLLEADGSRLTVCLMSTVYSGILDGIERVDYDVFQKRVYVSYARKLWLGLRAFFKVLARNQRKL